MIEALKTALLKPRNPCPCCGKETVPMTLVEARDFAQPFICVGEQQTRQSVSRESYLIERLGMTVALAVLLYGMPSFFSMFFGTVAEPAERGAWEAPFRSLWPIFLIVPKLLAWSLVPPMLVYLYMLFVGGKELNDTQGAGDTGNPLPFRPRALINLRHCAADGLIFDLASGKSWCSSPQNEALKLEVEGGTGQRRPVVKYSRLHPAHGKNWRGGGVGEPSFGVNPGVFSRLSQGLRARSLIKGESGAKQ